MSSQQSSGLQIGVVGAGVAGLSVAIALRKIGHDVEVYERSQFKNENGAAVSITPNGNRVLERWGFDTAKAGGIQCDQVRRPKGDTLEPMAPTLSFKNVEELYGSKWHFYHRVDMHKHLREMAEAHGALIRLGSQVMDLDQEAGIISLQDGSKVQKDLIVVADGQHDRLHSRVTGKDVPMQRSGQTAYRCLIPMQKILDDEETRHLFENEAPGFWAPALPPKGVMAVTYPCRDNTILNALVVHRKLGQHTLSEDEVTIEDWNFAVTHHDLEQVLEGFHPSVKKVFLKSPEVKMYSQMKRVPLEKMTRGKAVLIGDACHPMLLTHAQGVSSSFEDAAALEVFLADVPASQSVSSPPSQRLLERLRQFETFRLPRVSATQILTDPVVPGPQAAENYKKQEEEIRKYYSGPLPPTGSMPHTPPICQFFFGYDVRQEALKFLEDNPLPPPKSDRAVAETTTEGNPAVADPQAARIVKEAREALTAAQQALVEVTKTVAAAQKALDLATRSISGSSYVPPPVPQEPTAAVAKKERQRQSKSFENLRAKVQAMQQKLPFVAVRELPATSPERLPAQTENALKPVRSS